MRLKFNKNPRRPFDLFMDGKRIAPVSEGSGKILLGCMFKQIFLHDDMIEALWPNPNDQPEWWRSTIRVNICRLNKSLRLGGWNIKAKWGVGYRLERLTQ